MLSPLDSPRWHRIASLRPQLRAHVQVRRHVYRGQPWYVLDDRSAGRSHRLDASAWHLVAAMDGAKPLQQVWADAADFLGDQAPTQDQTIQLLGTLHEADLIQCELPPDARELFERRTGRDQARRAGALRSPFVVRFSLLDPERWLQRWADTARALFSRPALLLWLVWVTAAAVLAAIHWPSLASEARQSLARPANLGLLLLVYPLVKGLHELGHALATKAWHGEVHDTGIMLLVFMPVPYVDATSANAFENKWARITVAGAGIAVELALAALGLFVWLLVEPGLVRTVAFQLMVIGGVSTVLFNGNPLLRFDGYYMLADAVEIPNLGTRSSAWFGYLIRRYLLGLENARSPVRATGERAWFAVYGLASFVYRQLILAAIVLFVLQVSLLLGVILGVWAVAGQVLLPTLKSLRRLIDNPDLKRRRARAALASLAVVGIAGLAIAVPFPRHSLAEGIVWLGDDAYLRTGTDCFFDHLLAIPGEAIELGAPVAVCSDPQLQAQLRLAEARLAELRARAQSEQASGRARGQIAGDAMAVAVRDVQAAEYRLSRLIMRATRSGVLVVPDANDLPGRYLQQGSTFGYVMGDTSTQIRVAVAQNDMGLVRSQTRRATVRLADRPAQAFEAHILRRLPGASVTLPSAALGADGGGRLAVSAEDSQGRTAIEPVFQMQLLVPEAGVPTTAGGRAFVRFEHDPVPLALQAWRGLRGLLLKRLAV